MKCLWQYETVTGEYRRGDLGRSQLLFLLVTCFMSNPDKLVISQRLANRIKEILGKAGIKPSS